MKPVVAFLAGSFSIACMSFSSLAGEPGSGARAFDQLGNDLRSPNVYRTASGAPGPQYWQQRADYSIQVTLDEDAKTITGSETIDYTNNSPDSLRYLWLQLDQNKFRDGSISRTTETAGGGGGSRSPGNPGGGDRLSYGALKRQQAFADTPYGVEIRSVTDAQGNALPFTIVDTMMRIDLAQALATGESISFSVDWFHHIIEENVIGGRGGYEHFDETDTDIFFIAQWFPRMAAYTDYAGWQHKQFLGRGEFTLEFGDYDVEITVPADHIVSATGELQNARSVLSATQRTRLAEARNADTPVFIVSPEEALENEKGKARGRKTWRFRAENVRDFAWSSSRKFIWDAMIHRQDSEEVPEVLVMSFYPNEAEPIWSKYSSHSVAHTMEVYSRFSFPYPYPTAQSVNTWERGGMEYPMITFNGYRPTADEKTGEITYSRNIKHGLIGVIIHEIGHIYFPMTVNSDERQWTWMDEGLNSFLDYVAGLEWDQAFALRGGNINLLDSIDRYMVSTNQVPIMTNSESILQFGPNAYSKPAAGLQILRETIMGRELFDFAFREYANRWMFKRPTPEDFFRTMEDASAVDLDWFWRAWFYTTDHVDLAVTGVREYKISTLDPDVEHPLKREEFARDTERPLMQKNNEAEGLPYRVDRFPELKDLYTDNDQFTVTNKDRNTYQDTLDGLSDDERQVLERALEEDKFVYFMDFANEGGVPMPLLLTLHYQDGSSEDMAVPAEIWRRNAEQVTKRLILDKPLKEVELDRNHQTADADFTDNFYPPRILKSRLELYKSKRKERSLMADMLVKLKSEKGEDKTEEGADVPMDQQ